MKPFLVLSAPCRKFCLADELVVVVKTHLFSVHIDHHDHVHFSLVHPKLHLQYIYRRSIFRPPSILFPVSSSFIMQSSIKYVQCITVFGYLSELDFRVHVDDTHADVVVAWPKDSDWPKMFTETRQWLWWNQWYVLFFSSSGSLWCLCDYLVLFVFKLKVIFKSSVVDFDNFLVRSEIRHKVLRWIQELISRDLGRRNVLNVRWLVRIDHLMKAFKTGLAVWSRVHFYVGHLFSALSDVFLLAMIHTWFSDRVRKSDSASEVLLPFFSLLFFISFNNFVQFADLIVWIWTWSIVDRNFVQIFDLSDSVWNSRSNSVGNLLCKNLMWLFSIVLWVSKRHFLLIVSFLFLHLNFFIDGFSKVFCLLVLLWSCGLYFD